MRELEEPQYFLEGAVTVAGGIVGLKPTCGVPEGAKGRPANTGTEFRAFLNLFAN